MAKVMLEKEYENTNKEFEPIVIVLENEFEASVMRDLAGSIVGGGEVRRFTEALFDALVRMNIPVKSYFVGEIRTKA